MIKPFSAARFVIFHGDAVNGLTFIPETVAADEEITDELEIDSLGSGLRYIVAISSFGIRVAESTSLYLQEAEGSHSSSTSVGSRRRSKGSMRLWALRIGGSTKHIPSFTAAPS